MPADQFESDITVQFCILMFGGGATVLFTAESRAAPLKPQDQTAVTFRSREVMTLVHNAVCKSKSESCSSTQQISAEPDPQRVWKKEEEEVTVVSWL